MDRETARQTIRNEWRRIIPQITGEARQKVNGETSWICPLCAHGTHGDGLTRNPQSKDGNGLKCFGCGWSGDIIDLYQQTTGKDYSTALEELAQIAGVSINGLTDRNSPQSNFSGKGAVEHCTDHETQQRAGKRPTEETTKQLREWRIPEGFEDYYESCKWCLEGPKGEDGRKYLEKRGVLGPAMYNGAGYDPEERRIIIPCSKRFYIARSIDQDNKMRYKNPAKVSVELFNDHTLLPLDPDEAQEIFITEGVFDALSVIEAGGQSVALNSTNNARLLLKRLEELPTPTTLIISLDNDDPGRKAAQEVQEGLRRLKIPFITADISNGYKDANEALMADRSAFLFSVESAIQEAKAYREKLRQEAQRAEEERQQRTGAGMIDSFLATVISEKYKPIPTGITDIDVALYGGFTRQTLILLGAAPGAGKTAFAQWVFENMAKNGTSCLYLNLEMSRDQMLARSISRIAARNGDRITPAEVKQGYKWDAAQEIIVKSAAEEYKQTIAPRMIYNPDGVTADLDSILAYIETEAERAEAAKRPAPLVVLDYLQIVTGRDREDETALIKRAVNRLKHFAIQHNTVVFCIIAHNRASNQTGTVTQESGRDTSALEYSADLQLGLAFTKCLKRPGVERKAKEDLTPQEMQYVTLKITKGRDAKIGAEVDLHFNGETMTYTQIAKGYEEPGAPAATINRIRGKRA